MPLYHLKCRDGHELKDFMTYEKMIKKRCPTCRKKMEMQFAPAGVILFRPGVYEHISLEPKYIDSPNELVAECRKHGKQSQYMQDMGGLWRANRGRWV